MYQVCWIWYLWPCGSNPFFLPPQRTWYTPEGLSRCNPAKNWWQRFAVVCSLSQRLWQRSCPITCWSNGFLDQQVCWELEGTVSSLSGILVTGLMYRNKNWLISLTKSYENIVVWYSISQEASSGYLAPVLLSPEADGLQNLDLHGIVQGGFKEPLDSSEKEFMPWWGHYVYMYLIHMKSTYITKKKACIAFHEKPCSQTVCRNYLQSATGTMVILAAS